MKFLTHDGLLYFWNKTKAYIDNGLSTKANTSAIPTSLPANGGNSSTVGGYSASSFAKAPITYTVTLKASSWSSSTKSQTVTVSGILASDTPIVDIVFSSDSTMATEQKAWANVTRITTAANSIVVKCADKLPTIDIKIQLKVVR